MLKSNFSLCDTGRFLKDIENIQFIGKLNDDVDGNSEIHLS